MIKSYTMKKLLFSICLFVSLSSCIEPQVTNPADGKDSVQGMKPVYAELTTESIYTGPARSAQSLAGFVVFRDYLLVTERLQGIHVIDNIDSANPQSIAFWHIPGIRNFTVANNLLLVPVTRDLVTVDVTDVESIALVSITEGIFEGADANLFPDGYIGSFECVDLDQGIVVDWVEAELEGPDCWR